MPKEKRGPSREDSAEFVHNHELQTEQLKYAVRKEVEETNLLLEAKKSLMRSMKAEAAERERAEQQIQKLREQIQQVQQKAKQLQESIRDEKQKQRAISGQPTHSDSDDEEAIDVTDGDNGDDGNVALIDDYDELISELITRSSGATNASKASKRRTVVGISAEQRLRILRLAEEDKSQKARQEAMRRHKAIAKRWNHWDFSKSNRRVKKTITEEAFDVTSAMRLRDSLLYEGLEAEKELLASLNSIMLHYLEPLLKDQLISSNEAHDIFANIASFVPSQKQLLQLLDAVLAGKKTLGDLAVFFFARGDTFREYVETRAQCRENLLNLIRSNERVAKWFTDPFSTTSSSKIQQLLDKPVQYIIHYPKWVEGLLQCCPETSSDFEALASALATLNSVVRECGNPNYVVVSSNAHAQLIEIDMRFRWTHKGRLLGSFRSDSIQRSIRLQVPCQEWLADVERLKREPMEFQAIMFTDCLVLASPSAPQSSELLFHTFIPSEHLVIWDLPPLVGEESSRLEVVNRKTGFKMRLTVASEQTKEDFMRIAAQSQMSLDLSIDALLAELR